MRLNPIVTGLAVASALTTQAALAETTTLRVAHVWPGGSMIDKELFQAWATSVEEASQGRLEVEVYPGQTLTKSDKTYESIANGIADIGASAQGYTAGRFPLTQVIELPGVSASSRQGSCILQSLYDAGHLDAEYADTHPCSCSPPAPVTCTPRHSRSRRPKTWMDCACAAPLHWSATCSNASVPRPSACRRRMSSPPCSAAWSTA
ncbi:bacterial extracellular solute-binding protein, family 7 [Halomonas elongata]|uniref:Bacterial extracellular solute-binding protein, family 7 n=1 Tax=Halomonas elongata TaxID=2746 RepID=A0A1B8NXP1_HALEL|nr:bacterial extracellular solute-binding protein, family 7 [Halomonas elongata]